MNISAVSRIISNIQFIIYSFLSFIIFSILVTYAVLSYGITIPYILFPNFKAEQLYIKLDKKLILRAKQIDVTLSNNESHNTPLSKVPSMHNIIEFVSNNFHIFTVDKLYVDKTLVTFSYNEDFKADIDNKITLHNNEVDALMYYQVYEDYIATDLQYIKHKPSNIIISGKGIVDFNSKNDFSILDITLPDCANIKLHLQNNESDLAFNATSNELSNIKNIVDIFKLKNSISKWIVDYNKAQSYKILSAKGLYNFNDPKKILNTLYVHGVEKNVKYTFNEKLPPIDSPEVDIYFSHGILKIRPKEATYSQIHKVDKGGVDIDFNSNHVMLNVDIYANTKLDQSIVNIVTAYDVPLPILQVDGKTDAHVNLNIDLRTEDVIATGEFFVKESSLLLDGVKYKINNGAIRLHKNFLTIDTADISYENIIKAKANGSIDLIKLNGDFFLNTKDISIPISDKSDIKLLGSTTIQMHFSDTQEKFIFPKTQWKIGDLNASMEANSIQLQEKFGSSANIENLNININNLVKLNVDGIVDFSKNFAQLNAMASDFYYKSSNLNVSSKKDLPLKILFNKDKADINISSESSFEINEHKLEIKPIGMHIDNNGLELSPADIIYNDDISSKISSVYKFENKSATFSLENTQIFSKRNLFIEEKIDIVYEKEHFYSKELDIYASLNKDKDLNIKFNNISKLFPYSMIMQRYDIKSGAVELTFSDDDIDMNILLKDFHPILSKNGKNLKDYNINGIYQNGKLNLNMNEELHFTYDKKANLMTKNIDFNFYVIKDYINFIQGDEKSDTDILIQAQNCNILLGDSGRKTISDNINIKVSKDDIKATLEHKDGTVVFQSRKNEFTLSGYKLNDTFMNELFKFSTFKNGDLSFTMYGDFDNYTGILKIDNTIIKDYTVLNNTLAFFNTIPALVTFSIPGYSKQGLKASEIYSSFDSNNSIITLKDTKLVSKELIITAKGTSDLNKEKIDLLMQVKTDIGSSAKNIPLVGYIIFGDESISTTVKVYGDLKDPKVESTVAKSIIVAPYNIIKRTINLPSKIFHDIFDKKKNEEKEKK